MVFKQFRINCTFRILSLGASIYLFVYLLFRTSLYAIYLGLGFIILYQIYSLIRYIEKTNRDLTRFLQAIKYEDFSETFSVGRRGPSFDELSTAFKDVTQEIRRARSEREEQYQYLQTVVQHVGIGVVSFQQDGEVELMNNAAKRLLGVSQLKNIKSLESFNKPFVETLFRLRPGERALVKVDRGGIPLQLAINAAGFRMRDKKFTLVSIQDIHSELEGERMSKELEIAHQVQMRLLPKESPKFPGFDIAGICIPAKEVGGDYYDYINFGDKKLGIAIGDVSGKGVPAAIYMTLTKGVLQSQAEGDMAPKDVLTKVNQLMYQSIERGSFVSMFYAVLDTVESKFVCSRAGHNPAIHFRSSNGDYTFVQPAGIALGLEKGKIFGDVIQDEEIKLVKGDLIVFYTDGFTEAMNTQRYDYGEKRLLNIVRENRNQNVRELIEAVCQDIKEFAQGHPQHDDMTMVAVKVN